MTGIELLHRCVTAADCDHLLRLIGDSTDFLQVRNCVKHQRDGTVPEVQYHNFWAIDKRGGLVVFCTTISARPFSTFGFNRDHEFEVGFLIRILEEFNKSENGVLLGYNSVTVIYGFLAVVFEAWFLTKFPGHRLEHYPTTLYYVPKNIRQDQLHPDKEIPLPEGYSFAEADLVNDPQLLYSTWRHSAPGDTNSFRIRLQYQASAFAKHDSTNQKVAFESMDPTGLMSHLYTLPEHRGKGLGTAVEKKLCQKLVERDYVPFKAVEDYNTSVLASTERSPLWESTGIRLLFLKHVQDESA